MEMPDKPNYELQRRMSRQLIDIYIQIGLAIILFILCYTIFKPFINLMIWAVLLAVTMYPVHQKIANRLSDKQGRAAILLILLSTLFFVVPIALLISSFGESIGRLIDGISNNTLQIPDPMSKIAEWPIIGKKIASIWALAHENLPTIIQKLQPMIGSISKQAFSIVSGLAGSSLMIFLAWLVAGIIMANGKSSAQAALAIFCRIFGYERGEQFTLLSTATIRAVALGVIGVAAIQALVVGIIMLIADIPLTGLLALLVLLLAIVQIPVLLITLPVIVYVWLSGDYGNVSATIYSVLLFLSGMLDNILKPLMLGRGVNAPMPVILLGALGGMASNGIMGMFIGAVLLALGYQIFMYWVENNPHEQKALTNDQVTDN
ncbi:MAG TPA: AI-2E family transporter [Arenimonas sp.]|nr:AI-2E family transporter [Arenimonas sp.]